MKNHVLAYLETGQTDLNNQSFSISQFEKAMVIFTDTNQADRVEQIMPHVKDRCLKQCFQIACSKGFFDIVDLLLDKVTPLIKSRGLYMALSQGHVKISAHLLFQHVELKTVSHSNPLVGPVGTFISTLNASKKEIDRLKMVQKAQEQKDALDQDTPKVQHQRTSQRI